MIKTFSFINIFFTQGLKSLLTLLIYVCMLMVSKIVIQFVKKMMSIKLIQAIGRKEVTNSDPAQALTIEDKKIIFENKSLILIETVGLLVLFLLNNVISVNASFTHRLYKNKMFRFPNFSEFVFCCFMMASVATVYTNFLLIILQIILMPLNLSNRTKKGKSEDYFALVTGHKIGRFMIAIAILLTEIVHFAGDGDILINPIAKMSFGLIETYTKMLKI